MVHRFFVSPHLPRPWKGESTDNQQAAEGDDNQGEDQQKEVGQDVVRPAKGHESKRSKAEQPDTTNKGISESDSTPLLQAHISDRVDDGQVALHTGEEVKQSLSRRANVEDDCAPPQ